MGQKKRTVIIGAGISGLTFAWYLSKRHPDHECILIEERQIPGGHMETELKEGALFEKGPRVFKTSRCHALLSLIQDIGFFSEVEVPPRGKERYILAKGKLNKVPGPFIWMIIWSLLKELRVSPVSYEETVWEFACRRFGKKIAEQILDPIVLGIYAGDIKKLSLSAAFPRLKQIEEEKGSLTKGILASLLKRQKKPLNGAPLFSFKKGAGSFIDHLVKRLPYQISYGESAEKIIKQEAGFLIKTSKRTLEVDSVVIATPAYVAASLLQEERLLSIPYQPVTSISVVIEGENLPEGFGYLIPKIEKEEILGVLFDSNFSKEKGPVKFTVMLGKVDVSDEELKQVVDRVLSVHLKIKSKVKTLSFKRREKGIPQYILGHTENIQKIKDGLPKGVHLLGNYLEGVSVSDAVHLGKKEVDAFTDANDFQLSQEKVFS
jgi:protoporphyrinogen/coproporphyrinogen III oxidase